MDDERLGQIERRLEDLDERESATEKSDRTGVTVASGDGTSCRARPRHHLRAAGREHLLAIRSLIDYWVEQIGEQSAEREQARPASARTSRSTDQRFVQHASPRSDEVELRTVPRPRPAQVARGNRDGLGDDVSDEHWQHVEARHRARSNDRRLRRRPDRRRRRGILVPDDRARWRHGEGRRRDQCRRHADSPSAGHPAPDDGTSAGRRPLARRAGRDPVGVRGVDLPALRLRPGDPGRDRSTSIATGPRSASRCRTRPGEVRLIERDEAARLLPPIYDVVRAATPGFLARSDEWWARAGAGRSGVRPARPRPQVLRRPRARREAGRIRHVPRQAGVGGRRLDHHS